MAAIRKQTKIWLIGHLDPLIPAPPTLGNTLKLYFYNHVVLKTIVINREFEDYCHESNRELEQSKNTHTTFQPDIISKLKAVVDECSLVKK